MKKEKNGMTREQAGAIYQDLQTAMAKMLKNEARYSQKGGAQQTAQPKPSMAALKARAASAMAASRPATARPGGMNKGQLTAVMFLVVFATTKVVLSALEFSGFAAAAPAEASYVQAPKAIAAQPAQSFSKEEFRILTSLDSRRSELEEKARRLDDREQDIARKDREFAARLTELRELTEKLNNEREKNDKKRNTQLDQLANVYGSMNPQEASHLIEQLDVTIALSLLERMPEKRIGQILALMTPERALTITKLLSSRTSR